MPRRAPFPVRGLFGIHRGKILPSSDTRERITSTYRHRQALGNAFRGHLAVAERPRAHCEHTLLCAGLRGIQFAGICRHARPPDDAPELLQVCTASGRSRQLRARRPLSAEAFGHGPSRARSNAVGCGRYRLQGQLRCKSTDEPVHSNIFPLRY